LLGILQIGARDFKLDPDPETIEDYLRECADYAVTAWCTSFLVSGTWPKSPLHLHSKVETIARSS